jgi:UDP-N-acetylglucosamine/UDP-N-acetylgalactosamine diphosphorylase
MKLERKLRTRLEKAGQEFLAEHFETLDATRQETLREQLEELDFELVASLRAGEGLADPPEGTIAPLPYVPVTDRGARTAAAERGRAELRDGKVAFVLLAGGQASRLQWDGPKGTFPIGPATERSLFQILVEHVLRAGRDYGAAPPLCVTTSSTTDAAVRTYFERAGCFGLDRELVRFACQGSIPALDDDGRVILAAPDRVFVSPDGHGGAVQALATRGILNEWTQAGITTVCTLQIDNPILQVVDADFLGRLWTEGTPLATKIVQKTSPDEKVGVVVSVGGRPAIVEYSEITPAQAKQRDADGRLHE